MRINLLTIVLVFIIFVNLDDENETTREVGYFYVNFYIQHTGSTQNVFRALAGAAQQLDAADNGEDADILRRAFEIMQRPNIFSHWKQYFQEPISLKMGVCSPKESKKLLKDRHLSAFVSAALHFFKINPDAMQYFVDTGDFFHYSCK